MALGHNPSIPSNGLVYLIDAANVKSYPGSGTAVTDISGNGNNGTLTSGVSFSSNTFVFDGVDDVIESSANFNLLPTAGLTLFAWIKTSVADKWIIDKAPSAGGSGYVFAGTSLSTFAMNINAIGVQSISTYTSNTWRLLCGTWTPSTSLKVYLDGLLNNTNTTSIPASITDPSQNLWIGRRRSGVDYWNGSISSVGIFNRALSDAEIYSLFVATRGRYGV